MHVGCWGFVENLRRDVGAAAESLGFVHTPSLAHAASTALLRNGRLANRGDDGAVFDLQVTSDRVRRAMWLLEGVAQGQRLAALLGYRLERTAARVRAGDDALPDADATHGAAARARTSRPTSPSRCSRPATSWTA